MVEAGLLPCSRRMARGAVLAHASAMNVVGCVASVTCAGGITVLGSGFVTARASQPGVGGIEGEIANVVIEGLGIKRDDVEGSSLVLRVTAFALASDAIEPTMMPLFPRHVVTDVFMTGHAQRGLLLLAEPRVTLPALLLVLRVCSNDRAGHDQPLHGVRLRVSDGRADDEDHRGSREVPWALHSMRSLSPGERYAGPARQYIWTATTWIPIATSIIQNRGTCTTCHNANMRS